MGKLSIFEFVRDTLEYPLTDLRRQEVVKIRYEAGSGRDEGDPRLAQSFEKPPPNI